MMEGIDAVLEGVAVGGLRPATFWRGDGMRRREAGRGKGWCVEHGREEDF